MDNFIDNLAAKYGAGTKKSSKRKSAAKAETTSKSKRRRWIIHVYYKKCEITL